MSSPPRAIPLKCVNCGAKLEITPEMDRFACGYCGAEQLVERKGGTIALKGIEEAIMRVQAGTDRTASELALNRLSKELDEVNSSRAARHMKAQAERKRATIIAVVVFFLFGIAITSSVQSPGGVRRPEDRDSILPGLLLVVGMGGAIAIKVTLNKKANERLELDLRPLNSKARRIHEQIEKHRAAVDA